VIVSRTTGMSRAGSLRCTVGRAFFVFFLVVYALPGGTAGQQSLPDTSDLSHPQIVALADRLAVQLLAANKKKPFILGLTLPGDVRCPLGDWLADRISESLAQAHPELEVIPPEAPNSVPANSQFFHDRNQEIMANEKRALDLGAQVLVHGNFAAIPNGIGVTLLADDRLAGGDSHFEALAEIPLNAEMQARIGSTLPQRPSVGGTYKASTAGIGSAICELCPAPEYTYVAKAKKLKGIVILQVWVSGNGQAENTRIVRAPNSALANAAARTVRNWHFKPASNASGESVPVVVDVAVSFHLNSKQLDASAQSKKSTRAD
jgi:TonB family protein